MKEDSVNYQQKYIFSWRLEDTQVQMELIFIVQK